MSPGDDQIALHYDSRRSPGPALVHPMPTARPGVPFARGATSLGVVKGDRVVITCRWSLGRRRHARLCAPDRRGAPVVWRFRAGRGSPDRCRPVAIISASCGIGRLGSFKPFLDEAIRRSSVKAHRIMLQREQSARRGGAGSTTGMKPWPRARSSPSGARRSPRPTRSTILYPRDHGKPKGIVRDNGAGMHGGAGVVDCQNIYGVNPGETMFTASDVGWVVGHSYIVYGPSARRGDDDPLRASRQQFGSPARSGGSSPVRCGVDVHRPDRLRAIKRSGRTPRVP